MRIAVFALALTGLAACQAPITVSEEAPADLAAEAPVEAPVEPAPVDPNAVQMNELGGEIPKAAPNADIGEDGIDEAGPDGGT